MLGKKQRIVILNIFSIELLQSEGQLGAFIQDPDGVVKVLFATEGTMIGTLELTDTTGSVRRFELPLKNHEVE